ncbi:MAG: hypothetical protein COB00_17400 [Alcanivorax sp.]|nr:MAG: hypothetical protein COB00_17400 [Alcanivorax sp.]
MENTSDIRQEQRLRYIDLCAYILGAINRRKLMSRFDIKEAWSTRDFKRYQEMSPHNLVYDHGLRAYKPTKWFSPCFEHDTQDAIDLIYDGTQRITCEQKFAQFEKGYSIPTVLPKLPIVAPILRALNLNEKVEIEYLSRSSGKSKRTIAPHSLIKTGNFIYVRAFDHKTGEFRSFKLNRVMRSHDSDVRVEQNQIKVVDREWNQEIDVVVGINGNPENPDTIAFDYGLKNGKITIRLKQALIPFFLADWNIAPLEYDNLPDTLFPLKVLETSMLK